MPADSPPPLWRAPDPLLLASGSATRLGLLVAAGLPVEVRRSGVDERALEAALGPVSPAELARALARAKTDAVATAEPGRVVLGADQVLALDGRPLAKPSGADEARDQLRLLSGRRHVLNTAAILVVSGEVHPVEAEATVVFRDLAAGEIDGYVARLDPDAWETNGLYQVEALGQHLLSSIEGEHATVLGLPMIPLLSALLVRGLLSL